MSLLRLLIFEPIKAEKKPKIYIEPIKVNKRAQHFFPLQPSSSSGGLCWSSMRLIFQQASSQGRRKLKSHAAGMH